MFYYRIHGRPISCEWALPLADSAKLNQDNLQAREDGISIQRRNESPVLSSVGGTPLFSSEGTQVARLFDHGQTWTLDFNGSATFLIQENKIQIGPSSLDLEALNSILISQVLPMALTLSSDLVIHASALLFGSKVWAFMGAEGRGKSTLASFFREQGAQFVSDDALRLRISDQFQEPVSVYPGTPEIRIFESALDKIFIQAVPMTTPAIFKRRLLIENGVRQLQSLAGIFCLCPGDHFQEVSVEKIEKAEAFQSVLNNLFRLSFESEDALKKEFFAVTRLVEQIPFYQLQYPFDWKLLPQMNQVVMPLIADF